MVRELLQSIPGPKRCWLGKAVLSWGRWLQQSCHELVLRAGGKNLLSPHLLLEPHCTYFTVNFSTTTDRPGAAVSALQGSSTASTVVEGLCTGSSCVSS